VVQIIPDLHVGAGNGGLLSKIASSVDRREVFGRGPRRNDREKDAMKWFG
jgi:hypothetical protein